jgi:uncharacterized protein
MHILLNALAAAVILVGLVGAIVPVLPGIPLIFAGIWIIAGVDGYRHLGLGWLLGIAAVGAVGMVVDLLAGALGAKRMGAVLGELSAGNSVLRSAHAGVGAWVGLMFGTLIKLVSSLMMVALFGAGWWLNRGA